MPEIARGKRQSQRSRPWNQACRACSVQVAAYTGLRWGELAGLCVRRVDLLHRRITVAEQLLEVRGRLAFGPTKTVPACAR